MPGLSPICTVLPGSTFLEITYNDRPIASNAVIWKAGIVFKRHGRLCRGLPINTCAIVIVVIVIGT